MQSEAWHCQVFHWPPCNLAQAGEAFSQTVLQHFQDIHSGYGFAIGNVAAFDMGLDLLWRSEVGAPGLCPSLRRLLGVQVFQKLLFLLAVLGSISTARSLVPTPSQSDFRRRQLEPFSGGVRLVRTNLLYSDVQPVKASDLCTHLNPGPAV